MSRHDNMKPNAHSNTTIWSLLKDIFKLIITIGNLGISYIEDWLKSGAALVDVFGSVHFVSKEATAFVGLMASATGVAEESFAGAMNNLMKELS